MHTDKIWIVLVILAAVLILSWGLAQGIRGIKIDSFKNLSDSARPWKKEDEDLRELSQRVRDLKAPGEDEHKP